MVPRDSQKYPGTCINYSKPSVKVTLVELHGGDANRFDFSTIELTSLFASSKLVAVSFLPTFPIAATSWLLYTIYDYNESSWERIEG